MKKRLFYSIIILLFASNFLYAQNKTDKYCKVIIRKNFGYRPSIEFGTVGLPFKDSTVTNNLQAIKNNKNDVDVLDYMSRNGWILVSTVSYSHTGRLEFYFKKAFDTSEIIITDNSN
jgi:hypothetical protein